MEYKQYSMRSGGHDIWQEDIQPSFTEGNHNTVVQPVDEEMNRVRICSQI